MRGFEGFEGFASTGTLDAETLGFTVGIAGASTDALGVGALGDAVSVGAALGSAFAGASVAGDAAVGLGGATLPFVSVHAMSAPSVTAMPNVTAIKARVRRGG